MRTLVSRPGTTEPTLIDAPEPVPGPHDVVIDVAAAAVHPVDPWIAGGEGRERFGLTGPVGLGWDVSGRVSAVGTAVTAFRVGDLVAGLHTDLTAPARAQATRVVLPDAAVAVLPDGLDPVAAASVPLNALTAAQALDLLGPAEGRTLLVTGAAGAVGGYAVALAAAAGWTVSGLARPTDAGFVRSAGADPVTDLDGRPWDAVLDAAVLREPALAAVVDGGRYVGVQPAFPLAAERGVTVADVSVTADGARLAGLLERSRTGELAVRVAGTAPLEDAAATFGKVAAGGQRGRWLLTA